MTSCAIFRMNMEIDTLVKEQLRAVVETLECTLRTAFPDTEFTLLGSDGSRQIEDLLISARRTAMKLQTGLLSSRLEVTIAQTMDCLNAFYGTSAFGIDRVTGTDRKMLMDAKPITHEELQSFLNSC